MKLPKYVTVTEVKRICSKLNVRDWTELKKPTISFEEAKIILPLVNKGGMDIDIEEFRKGSRSNLNTGQRLPTSTSRTIIQF